jgi:hypothetical protein
VKTSATNWPALPLDAWRNTCETLHMWTQIIGKVRLALTPTINHWWNVPLYVTASGLTTSAIDYGDRWFDVEFDFLGDVLRIRTNTGDDRTVALAPRTVADFYQETMAALKALGIDVRIWTMPVEVQDPIPFDKDVTHRSYDRESVLRFWQILALSEEVFTNFRARFIGKCSPIHFFWGSFDLAVTRFSGRPAPEPPKDVINREAYSHEVSSVGWWTGDSRLELPTYYSYAWPEPEGFRKAGVSPAAAYYNSSLNGFYLHYDEVRRSSDPEKTLLDFCETTYAAAAGLGKWDRAALERRGR